MPPTNTYGKIASFHRNSLAHSEKKKNTKYVWTAQMKTILSYSAEQMKIFYFFVFFLGPYLWHMEAPQAKGQTGATATCLHHSHSNVGSKPCLCPTPQLIAMPSP